MQSNIVTSGFSVTLALANLGFVLAIIVIAIMTILRYETYALKQTLWKLVAAAILVNFSLVIGAAILNFADTLTLYFLNAFNPGGSLSAFDAFSTSLAGAFAPQRVFLNLNAQGQSITDTNFDAFAGAGTSFAPTLVALMNLFFPTLFLIVSVIALAGLFIMLLIRYVYLGILLILMPLAWLLWIFPATSSQWQKWWTNFIKWTIFAPVVMFFLYLALMTLGGANANQVNDPNTFFSGLGITQNVNSPSAGFVSTSLGGSAPTFGSTILGSLLQMIMMVAMLFAGLFMANSMGIMFADTVLKGATAVTSGFGRLAGRKSLQYGSAPIRKKREWLGGKSVAEHFQQRASNIKNPVGRWAAAWGARGVTKLSSLGGADIAQEEGKKAVAMNTPDLQASIPTSFGPKKVARINELGKRQAIDAGNMADTHSWETMKLFESFGMSKEYEKNVEKTAGVSSEMYEASKRGDPQEDIDALAAKFAAKFSRAEVGAMQVSDLHSRKAGNFGLDTATITKLAKANAYGFAAAAPQFASSILSRTKSDSLDNFANDYRDGLVNAESRGVISTGEYTKRDDSFKTNLTNNMMGFTPMTGSAGGGGAPSGGAPPPPGP